MRLQGCQDSPLIDVGLINAFALRDYLNDQNLRFDAVYTSPIKRAYNTAQLVFPHQIITRDDRIREMNFGLLEGKRISELNEEELMMYQTLWNKPEDSQGMPEGEDYDSIEARTQDFLNDIVTKDHDKIFIMTHGFCFIMLLARMLKLERKDYVSINRSVVEGCSITIVDYSDGKFTLETLGDAHFLPFRSKADYSASK